MNFIEDKELNLKEEGNDLLNGKSYSDTLKQIIKNAPSKGTFCVGLFGEWGSGKSSIIKTVKDDFEKFMETWPQVARQLKAGGKYFMYHNHDREFIRRDGKPILEILAESIPAEDMGFTLDTFWVQAGGGDPAQWIERLGGRVPAIHLKDYAYGRSMAVVGEGNINFARVFEKAEAAGTKYMLVEQDDCHGEDPFACLRRSYEYLRSWGFQ